MNNLLVTLTAPVSICMICAITAITAMRSALTGAQPRERAAILRAVAALVRAIHGKP